MKPTLTWRGCLSKKEVSTSASARRARRSDAVVFDQNKEIFSMVMPKSLLEVEEFKFRTTS